MGGKVKQGKQWITGMLGRRFYINCVCSFGIDKPQDFVKNLWSSSNRIAIGVVECQFTSITDKAAGRLSTLPTPDPRTETMSILCNIIGQTHVSCQIGYELA